MIRCTPTSTTTTMMMMMMIFSSHSFSREAIRVARGVKHNL